MKLTPTVLRNTADIELWPAHLLRARSSRDARALARAQHVLRRKSDGAYLAADLPEGLLPLVTRLMHEAGIDDALDALDNTASSRVHAASYTTLSLHRLHEHLDALGIDASDYEQRTSLTLTAEPSALAFAGRDRFHRPLWLRTDAARAWQRMQHAAHADGIVLDAISGYRSHDYQQRIFDRKLDRGDTLDAILRVNAAPGFSEHHSGRALDIGTPGEPPAEASFEATPAFAWLRKHADTHGFTMSYPRDNPHGIVFEPWHWAYRSAG
ncbi:MAG: M15 family metallopeptidase [Luteimonas sp.]